MIYIVALGVGFKCPHKIHLYTQCPPPPGFSDLPTVLICFGCKKAGENLSMCLLLFPFTIDYCPDQIQKSFPRHRIPFMFSLPLYQFCGIRRGPQKDNFIFKVHIF